MTQTLVDRLRERARIRRQIPTRKSVQSGEPDRIADLLEESADTIKELRMSLGYWLPKKKPLDGFVSEEILAHQTMWESARAILEKTK